MKSRIVLSALFVVCLMGPVASQADETPAAEGKAPVAVDAYARPQPVEGARPLPSRNPAEGPHGTLHVRMRDNVLSIGTGGSDGDGLSIACREFRLHFSRDDDEPFRVECRGDVRLRWPESWAGLPACRMLADELSFHSADQTAVLKSGGGRPCRLEFSLPGAKEASSIDADEIRLQLRTGRIEASGTTRLFLRNEEDD